MVKPVHEYTGQLDDITGTKMLKDVVLKQISQFGAVVHCALNYWFLSTRLWAA